MSFRDRAEAGRRLAAFLAGYKDQAPVVLALPRGGVAVAAEVASALSAPLDLIIVRKIGAPGQPELAMGAIVDGPQPTVVRNEDVIGLIGIGDAAFEAAKQEALAEIRRRRDRYMTGRTPIDLAGRTAIVVDDGIATGATVRAALRAARATGPGRLVLATPVAPTDALADLKTEADEIVCVEPQAALGAIGLYYADFRQMSDDDVLSILARFPTPPLAPSPPPAPPRTPLEDWNVVVTAHKDGGRQALRALRQLGQAGRSRYYNVFLATVADPLAALETLEARAASQPVLIDTISRIAPAQASFAFASQTEFEQKLMAAATPWLGRLAGKSFHVRVHRRGTVLDAATQAEEARLGEMLLAALAGTDRTARIAFDDPDLVLAVDAIDGRAGLALWSREDLKTRRFLRPD